MILYPQDVHLEQLAFGNSSDTCDFTHIHTLCELDLLKRSAESIEEEIKKTAQCFIKEPPLASNDSNSEEMFRCLATDIQRTLQSTGNVILSDIHIQNLFFDGNLDNELNSTDLYYHDCILCFLAQFHMMVELCKTAFNIDKTGSDFSGSQSLNITIWDELTQTVQAFLDELNYLKEIRPYYKAKNVSTSSPAWFENYTDVENWVNFEFNIRTHIMALTENPASEFGYEVTVVLLVLHGALFIVGFIGNSILFLIFVRHREMLSASNVIILNLAIGDTLSLISNIIVSYMFNLSDSMLVGFLVCLSITLFIPLSTGVCVYSVTMLAIQRYAALVSLGKHHGCRLLRRFSSVLFICAIWILAAASAVPRFLETEFHEDYCAVQITEFSTVFNLVAYCVIPLLTTVAFSTVTSSIIRSSVHKMPGEVMGQRRVRNARTRSANILMGLTVVFAISYVPYYLFLFLYHYFNVEKLGFLQMFIISYTLIFVNSCCNPVALYAASGNFRQHFNRYLQWCCHFGLNYSRKKNGEKSTSQYTQKSTIRLTNL
jgi:hypothetical protein